jgi:hypothetical protein
MAVRREPSRGCAAELPGTTYALVIFTESTDSTDEADRIEMIHALTETIVDAVFPPSPPGP